ncbi:MAG: hypothetical protein KYX69_19185 [Sphingomonas sp.]|uniref:DUF7668 domain-containing protein n=1 Tax=Sphingomonas sp. TaxID=28214 RepID=UPI002628A4E6|nr:hypothetical protein [Sphingomonas sp.]MDK2769832.1 hypothetical protein [Sphingomonas sp.]
MRPERDEQQHSIPEELRGHFVRIVDAFVAGDYSLQSAGIAGVDPIDADTAEYIEKCIAAYGDALAPLDPAVWERSCYGWSGDHWEMLVDLTTQHQEVSDLTLHVDVRLDPLRIAVRSVHVP